MTDEIVQELVAQRDFLLTHRWVPHPPRRALEGCLVGRRPYRLPNQHEVWLSIMAVPYVQRVLGQAETGWVSEAGRWNDEMCQGPGEAIAVLDEAIRLVKEDVS